MVIATGPSAAWKAGPSFSSFHYLQEWLTTRLLFPGFKSLSWRS